MSEYMFLTENGKLTRENQQRHDRAARAATKATGHTVTWAYVNLPGDGWRSWFATANRGTPFDQQVESVVREYLNLHPAKED